MMKKWEEVHIQQDGSEKVIHKNLTEKEANEYFYGIDNTYIREMKEEAE